METRNKSNAEFRNEVVEILARHESSFELMNNNYNQINSTLQTVLAELQALRINPSTNMPSTEVNPFAAGETSHNPTISRTQNFSSTSHAHNQTHLKLNFPTFGGDDPTGWIYKAEQYFEFKNIAFHQRVQLASFHLEGIALQWHRWLSKFKGPLSWDEFTKAILHRFGPTDYNDPSEALSRLKQDSSVQAYQEAFERLSHRVDNLLEHYLVGCFIAGLKDVIRLDVKVKQPKTLAETIGVARLIEERNHLQQRTNTTFYNQQSSTNQKTIPNPSAGLLRPPPTYKSNQQTASISVRRITGQEAKERREKGLCYYCDEKFVPGHRCEQPQLFMMEDLTEFDPCGQG